MPATTTASLHTDAVLTNFALGYGQDLTGFVGDEAATIIRVDKQSDLYNIWNKSDFFRIEMEKVADGASSPRAEPRLSSSSYYADVYKLKSLLTDEKMSAADDPQMLELGTVRYLMVQAKRKRELIYATEIHATGLWTANAEQTGVASGPTGPQFLQWNDAASTPLVDIAAQKQVVRINCGHVPNTFTIDQAVFDQLVVHPDVVARYQYTDGGAVDQKQLEALIGMQIKIGSAMYNSAIEGKAAVMTAALGTGALITYQDDTGVAAGQAPTAATGFAWNALDKVDATGAAIDRWRVDDPDGEYLRATMAIDYKITANDAGVYMATAIA